MVYQVNPPSFAAPGVHGAGTLRGVTARIPYLAALGIDAVWLSPFDPSALADDGPDGGSTHPRPGRGWGRPWLG